MNGTSGNPAQERREECRRAVLEHLAARQAVACHPKDIRRALNAGHDHDFEDAEVTAALTFLVGAELAREVREPLGATVYFQATSRGVLAHERGGSMA